MIQQLRPHHYRIGDWVHIGTNAALFKVVGFGIGGPDVHFGEMTNEDEFVQLKVPGHEYGRFGISMGFICRALVDPIETAGGEK